MMIIWDTDTCRLLWHPGRQSHIIKMFKATAHFKSMGLPDPTNGLTASAAYSQTSGIGNVVVYNVMWPERLGRLDSKSINLLIYYRIGSKKYVLLTVGVEDDEHPISIRYVGETKFIMKKSPLNPNVINVVTSHTSIQKPPGHSHQVVLAEDYDTMPDFHAAVLDYQNKKPIDDEKSLYEDDYQTLPRSDYQTKKE